MKERVELNSSVQSIPLFIAVSLPKVYQKHNHQYLEKVLYQEGTDRLSYFVYKIFPLRPPKTL